MNEELQKNVDRIKEQSKFCIVCGQKTFMNSSIHIVEQTESGQIVEPYESDDGGASLIVPLCSYHFVLANEGIIASTMHNEIIYTSWIPEMEKFDDKKLNEIKRIKRDEKSKIRSHYAKTILDGRMFAKEMNDADKIHEELKSTSFCAKHTAYIQECPECRNILFEKNQQRFKVKK